MRKLGTDDLHVMESTQPDVGGGRGVAGDVGLTVAVAVAGVAPAAPFVPVGLVDELGGVVAVSRHTADLPHVRDGGAAHREAVGLLGGRSAFGALDQTGSSHVFLRRWATIMST